jgi:DNA-binding transcriptional MerR regulator
MDEQDRKKRYYSISEVAEMLDLKQHILRYWEKEFPQLKPRKNRAGNRAYTENDIRTLTRIKELLHDEKFTIKGAKSQLGSVADEADDQFSIPFEKIRIRNELAEIKQEILKLIEQVKEL